MVFAPSGVQASIGIGVVYSTLIVRPLEVNVRLSGVTRRSLGTGFPVSDSDGSALGSGDAGLVSGVLAALGGVVTGAASGPLHAASTIRPGISAAPSAFFAIMNAPRLGVVDLTRA